jgi:CheY-like chemotaxis protein/signal transduction histidine kinase/CHASE3 domain sensor protein
MLSNVPADRSKTTWIFSLVFIVFLIVLFNGWILDVNFQKVSEQGDWVRHSYEVIQQLNQTLSETRGGEANALVYLETRDPTRLDLLRANEESALAHFKSAQNLISDNYVQEIYSRRLEKLITERQGNLMAVVKVVQNGGGVNKSLLAPLTDDRTFVDLRETIESMKSTELHLLDWRSTASTQSKITFLWVLIFTTALSVFIIAFAAQQARKIQLRNEKETRERIAEAKQNETISQVAELMAGDIGLETAAGAVLSFLSEKLGIIASKIYLIDRGRLGTVSSHSVQDPGFAKPAPGLVLDAFNKKGISEITNLPADYWKIESGLGEALPRNLTFLPLNFQGSNIGVIEMASLVSFGGDVIEILKKVGESVAIGLNAARSRRDLQELLEKTQLQAEELQTQQEELKVSNEELQEQSTALKESQARLEGQQQELEQINQQLEEQAQTLEMQKDDLQRKSAELEMASRYKSEFLANMSHELRTPLNSSLILAKLLADNPSGNLSKEQVQFAETIRSAGIDLLNLINDILDLAKVEAGMLEVHVEGVSSVALLESLERTFTPIAQDRGLKFLTAIETKTPKSFETDRQRLEQILKNLLSNALKFTEKGEVSLTMSERGENIVFSISDTGIGIPDDQLEKIFEAFRQVDGSNNRKYGGTGLGLSISKELAKLLGGKIEVSSQLAKGSLFKLIIPKTYSKQWRQVHEEPRSESYSKVSAPRIISSVQDGARFKDDRENLGSSSKILLAIEDDASFANVLYNLAKELGFQCLLASTAKEGIELAKKYPLSGIILDLVLPDQMGTSVLHELKHSPATRHIPVHIISGQDDLHPLLEKGAVGVLKKPVERAQIAEALKKLESKLVQTMKHVLVVEDHAHQRESIVALLRGPDVQTVAVATGTEALRELSQQQYDCVVIDLSLPDMTGFELLSKVSERPDAPFPPIIVYTGRDLTRDEEDQLRKYSNSIIVKGARSPERLLDEVSLFIHRLESSMAPDKQRILQSVRSRDEGLEGKQALIVDDDVRNIFALMGLLESRGLKVTTARTGKEALLKLEANPKMDIVLMDIMMPEMDGYEATRAIRKQSRFARLPIIAVTAKAMASDHDRCIEAGASDYLAKPIDPEKLFSLMRVWIERA